MPERIFGLGEHSVLLQEVLAHEFSQLIAKYRPALASDCT